LHQFRNARLCFKLRLRGRESISSAWEWTAAAPRQVQPPGGQVGGVQGKTHNQALSFFIYINKIVAIATPNSLAVLLRNSLNDKATRVTCVITILRH
jgi:hypothetical protein